MTRSPLMAVNDYIRVSLHRLVQRKTLILNVGEFYSFEICKTRDNSLSFNFSTDNSLDGIRDTPQLCFEGQKSLKEM